MNHSNEMAGPFESILSLSNDFPVGMFKFWGIFINMADWMHPVSHDLIFLTSFYETCRHVVSLLFLTMERHFHFFANIRHIKEVDRAHYLVLMVIPLSHSASHMNKSLLFFLEVICQC